MRPIIGRKNLKINIIGHIFPKLFQPLVQFLIIDKRHFKYRIHIIYIQNAVDTPIRIHAPHRCILLIIKYEIIFVDFHCCINNIKHHFTKFKYILLRIFLFINLNC